MYCYHNIKRPSWISYQLYFIFLTSWKFWFLCFMRTLHNSRLLYTVCDFLIKHNMINVVWDILFIILDPKKSTPIVLTLKSCLVACELFVFVVIPIFKYNDLFPQKKILHGQFHLHLKEWRWITLLGLSLHFTQNISSSPFQIINSLSNWVKWLDIVFTKLVHFVFVCRLYFWWFRSCKPLMALRTIHT